VAKAQCGGLTSMTGEMDLINRQRQCARIAQAHERSWEGLLPTQTRGPGVVRRLRCRESAKSLRWSWAYLHYHYTLSQGDSQPRIV